MSKLNLICIGVAYAHTSASGVNENWAVSQDPKGKVWKHPIDELPDSDQGGWNTFGCRYSSPHDHGLNVDPLAQCKPIEVIDTWINVK